MKYFKFALISEETGISWAIEQPLSGPSYPKIPGLENSQSIQLDHSRMYYIAKVADDAVANPDNHIFEITFEEYSNEIKNHVMKQLNIEKDSIYRQELDFRNLVFSKYHMTASAAGIYKYEQAKSLLLDSSATAPEIRTEAEKRGISPIAMANKVIENHESFRQKEAKIAGIRGLVLDRLENFQFDSSKPEDSLNEFMSTEVIGKVKVPSLVEDKLVDTEVNVEVRKYILNLPIRFEHG